VRYFIIFKMSPISSSRWVILFERERGLVALA
jgi:hypothetical protein